jgi:CRISPR-associated protein Cas1
MSILYVTQPGAEVRKKAGRLQVEWQGQVLTALPLRSVERLVCLGPVQLSAAAARSLLEAQIPVLFGSVRGRCYGVLSGGSEDVERFLIQVERYQDQAYRLAIAKAIVSAKGCHQQRLLRRHARNHPNPSLTQAADHLDRLLGTLPQRASVPEVMGVEGQASALYFSVFGHCLRQSGITFTDRNRRPPRDPVNAILSLGYMLVLGEVLGMVMAQGLHPGLGFLHEVNRRRPSLALDLLEPARQPIVDRLTLSLFNRGVLTPADFQGAPAEPAVSGGPPTGGVRLKEDSLKRYLEFYERALTTPFRQGSDGHMGTLRDWLRDQAEALRKSVVEGRPWAPATLEL